MVTKSTEILDYFPLAELKIPHSFSLVFPALKKMELEKELTLSTASTRV